MLPTARLQVIAESDRFNRQLAIGHTSGDRNLLHIELPLVYQGERDHQPLPIIRFEWDAEGTILPIELDQLSVDALIRLEPLI